MKILITGGHHTSALAVIDELKKRNKEIELIWVGHKYSMVKDVNVSAEYKDINELKIPFYDIKAGKFYGIYNPLQVLKILRGFINAFSLLLKTKPNLILSFGGYIAVPVVVCGYVLGIPAVTHEQTVVSGLANKVIAVFVKKIFISWKDSYNFYPKEKIVFTGLPLRKEIFTSTTNEFVFNNNLPVVYITGGKQGSHLLNEAVREILPEFLKHANVIHQCGDNSVNNDYEKLVKEKEALNEELKGRYYISKYIKSEQIGEVFKKSSLIISRAGAHSVYEFISLKKPALLIPISWVSHNEQVKNAIAFEKTGLGRVLYENNLVSSVLLEQVLDMLNNLPAYQLKYNPIEDINSAYVISEEALKSASKTS